MIPRSIYILIYLQCFQKIGFSDDAINNNVVVLNDDSVFTWQTPDPYESSENLIVKVEDGYLIEVNVLKCDLAGEDGDFLILKSGESLEESGTGRTFTYNINTPRKYLVSGGSVFLQFEVKGTNENSKSGATITFQRYGERGATTQSTTTTTNNYPTPSENDSIYLTVNVSGKLYTEYKNEDVVYSFKKALSEMASEYCRRQLIFLSENITTSNVQITLIIRCPMMWPTAEECVQITFAIPVVLDTDKTNKSGYELTSDNLYQMWMTIGSDFLQQHGFDVYKVPDNLHIILLWTGAFVAVLIIFFMLLIIMKYLFKGSGNDKSSISDTASIISRKKISDISLSPHPLQSTPQLFENDYPMYEPGFAPTNFPTSFNSNPAFEDDESSDDEIDIPIHFAAGKGKEVNESET